MAGQNPVRISIYLDVCCLNRPFDDQTQSRVHLEAEAVQTILARVQMGSWDLVSSEAVQFETDQMSDAERKRQVLRSLDVACKTVVIGQVEKDRAFAIEALGFRPFDALHLACAESGGAVVFLTTDDRLLRKALRHPAQLQVRVRNPLTWLVEV